MGPFQDKRIWISGGAITALLVAAIGWFVFVGPKLSSADSLRSQAAATGQQNTALRVKVKSLQVKSTQVARYTAQLRTAFSALPFDSGLPAFTRQLSSQAAADGVSVTSVVVGGITAVAAVAPTTPQAATPTPAPATTADPANPTGVAPAATAGSLFAVAVTIQSNGTLAKQLSFLKDIRTAGARRALVISAIMTPGTGAKEASIDQKAALTLQLTVFSAPRTPAQITQLEQLLSGKIGN